MTVRNKRAYSAYLIMEGVTAFLFSMAFTISAIYRIQVVHLDPLQLVLVGTVLEATAFLCEVPTGIVADTFSRKLSILVGIVLLGAGFLVEGALPFFWAVLLAQVVQGVGYTFTSGANEAWIAGEIGEENLQAAFMRAQQVGMGAGLAGTGVSVALASVGLNLPILAAGGAMALLGLLLALIMPETGFRPVPREERTTWAAMAQTFAGGVAAVHRRPVLVTFLVISAFIGMASEGFDRLWEAHLLANFSFPDLWGLNPVVWFGIINAVAALIAIATTEIARRRLKAGTREQLVRALTAATALRIGAGLLFSLAGNFWMALAGRWGRSVFTAITSPLQRAWLTQTIDPQVRATVISMSNQVDALGQVAGGPALGWIGSSYGVRAALTLSVVLLSPLVPLYARAHKQDSGPQAETAPDGEIVLEPAAGSE